MKIGIVPFSSPSPITDTPFETESLEAGAELLTNPKSNELRFTRPMRFAASPDPNSWVITGIVNGALATFS